MFLKTKAYRCSRLTVRSSSEKIFREYDLNIPFMKKINSKYFEMCFDCFSLTPQPSSGYSPGQRPWESWPEAVRVLARGRARGISPGPVNVALLALELVSPSRSLPVDSLSRSSEGGSEGTRSRALFPCMPDTPAVLSSVVVCGRLTLLSFSKILLLHHDPWAG